MLRPMSKQDKEHGTLNNVNQSNLYLLSTVHTVYTYLKTENSVARLPSVGYRFCPDITSGATFKFPQVYVFTCI